MDSSLELAKWKGVLWADSSKDSYIAFCPKHRLRLEVWDWKYQKAYPQEFSATHPSYLLCPEDNEQFELFGDSFFSMARRYGNYKESLNLKNAKIVDLDNIYTPY